MNKHFSGTTMTNEYTYFAFISYKREDEKWAKWLQHKLEHYKLPASIRKANPALPEKARPVFKDTTDLAGGVLEKAIKEALQSSKYLIVICSPRAAQSPWVCKEVQEFIDSGREEYIIPFIIDGEPHSANAANECFPQSLRELSGERELLGININEMGRDAAAIKVAARMFELHFDSLWQRYSREKNKRLLITIIGVVLFAIISLGVGGYIAQTNLKLDKVNEGLIVERNNATKQRQRAERTADSLKNAYDSIYIQNRIIREQSTLLAKEREKAVNATWGMMENKSRYLSSVITEVDSKGDNYTAKLLALEILPMDIDNPDRPMCIDSERALRSIYDSPNSFILLGHKEPFKSAHFSPDNKTILSSDNNTIRIWDIDSGAELSQIQNPNNVIHTAIYSPTGDYIISSGNDKPDIMIWDSRDGTLLDTLIGHTTHVTECTFSYDGKVMASCSGDGTVRLWDTQTWEEIRCYHMDCSNIIFSPCGNYLISIHYNHGMKIWNVHTGERTKSCWGDSSVRTCAFSPNSEHIILGLESGEIEIRNFQTMETIRHLKEHSDEITSITINPINNTFASSSEDMSIVIWDLTNYTHVEKISTFHAPIKYIEYCPNGNFLLVLPRFSQEQDKAIKVLDLREYYISPTDWLDNEQLFQPNIAISPNGETILAEFDDSIIHIFEARTLNHIRSYSGHKDRITSISFSPNGQFVLYTTRDNYVCILDFNDGHELRRRKFQLYNSSAFFSPKGNNILVSDSSSDYFYIWDWEKDVVIRDTGDVLRHHPYYYTPKEGKIWTITEGTILMDDMDSYIPINRWIWNAAISSDESLIATAQAHDYDIHIYDRHMDEIAELKGHQDEIISLMFHPNKKYLLSYSNDLTIRLWDVEQECEIHKYIGFKYATFCLDGNRIIGISVDNTIHTWEFKELQELIDLTRKQFAGRQLTTEERRTYYLE